MARPKSAVPAYSHHVPSGQACVYIDRRRVYLGPYGSPESRERYASVLAEVTAKPAGQPISSPNTARQPRMNDLLLKFATDRLPKYVTASGQPSAEQACFQGVIRIVRELFGETPIAEFGPIKLRAVRNAMIGKGWCRRYINKEVSRLRSIIRFGVGWELASPSVLDSLRAVEPLKPGDSDAPESQPRRAVSAEDIQAAKSHLRQRNCDLVDLLLATGARPGEILGLTTAMIDRSGEVWRADLEHHKNRHRGHSRTLFFGAQAQAILQRYLRPAQPQQRLFPVDRKTFGTAVKDACLKAGIEPFTPHFLRHTAGTRIADELGIEAAQRVLGHATISMTSHYSATATKLACEAAKRLG